MPESITQFYKRIQSYDIQSDTTYSMEKPYFNIFSRQCNFGTVQFSYREFYKITLIIGVGKLYYADKWILVDRPALLFSNPLVPYAWESISEEQKGMFCIFNEQFVQSEEKNGSLANTPLFKITGDKVFFLDDTQVDKVLDIYMQMQEENQSGYVNKSDVLRCYLHLLIHTALKMQDFNQYESFPNASQRIAELFMELLERQFPIDYPRAALVLRTSTDYANRLSVYVNHLNKVIKETTGKTTSVGGVSVGAHCCGRVVDVNNALDGDGPFSPERSGGLPTGALVELCFSGKSKAEVKKMLKGNGGVVAYLGTNDMRLVEEKAPVDAEYGMIQDAMCYQIGKEIGAMAAVLKGKVDAILLTGGIAYGKPITDYITRMVGFIAPVKVYPGEDEMRALAMNGLMVLRGEMQAKTYA